MPKREDIKPNARGKPIERGKPLSRGEPLSRVFSPRSLVPEYTEAVSAALRSSTSQLNQVIAALHGSTFQVNQSMAALHARMDETMADLQGGPGAAAISAISRGDHAAAASIRSSVARVDEVLAAVRDRSSPAFQAFQAGAFAAHPRSSPAFQAFQAGAFAAHTYSSIVANRAALITETYRSRLVDVPLNPEEQLPVEERRIILPQEFRSSPSVVLVDPGSWRC